MQSPDRPELRRRFEPRGGDELKGQGYAASGHPLGQTSPASHDMLIHGAQVAQTSGTPEATISPLDHG